MKGLAERILVVDDTADLRQLLKDALEAEGYRVDLAQNAGEAQEYLRGRVPDLILMDVMMPDMNGVDLCGWVHRQSATRNVPVIQLSSLQDETTMQDSLEMGAVDYIHKPVGLKVLIEKVERALGPARRKKGES